MYNLNIYISTKSNYYLKKFQENSRLKSFINTFKEEIIPNTMKIFLKNLKRGDFPTCSDSSISLLPKPEEKNYKKKK